MSDQQGDLYGYLADKRETIERLLGRFDSESWSERGATVQLVVVHQANLDAVRSELLRSVLEDDKGHPEFLQRYDQMRERRLGPMTTLDAATVGVGPADVFQSEPGKLVNAFVELRGEVEAYDRWEAEELVPHLKQVLDDEQAARLGERVEKISKFLPSHTHPGKGPADERSWPTKLVEAATDRLKDELSHPTNVLGGGGEMGP